MYLKRLAVALCAVGLPVFADQINWTATAPGLFNDANNWTSIGGAGHVVPGSADFVSFANLTAPPGPDVTVVPNNFSFGIQQLFISGISTTFVLQGTTNNVNLDLLVEGGSGGNHDNPVVFGISGSGGINVGQQVLVGQEGGTTSVLSLANGSVLNAGTLAVGGSGTQGIVAINSGSITASSVQLGFDSPGGPLSSAISVSDGSVTANGGGGITVGNFGGTGGIKLNPNSSLNLTAGTLTIGASGGTGSIIAQGDEVLEGSLIPLPTDRFASVNANGQNVVIGAPTGTGSVQLTGNASLNTTGTVTIGFGGSSQGSVSMAGTFGITHFLEPALNAGTLVVGDNNGIGTLGMQDFSVVNVTNLIVGRNTGAGCTAPSSSVPCSTVSVPGLAAINANQVSVGINGGTGLMVIGADSIGPAALNAPGGIEVGDGTTGANGGLSISGAVTTNGFLVGIFQGNTGGIQMSGSGTATVSGTSFIGSFGGQGSLSLKDNSLFYTTDTSDFSLVIGSLQGTGTLSIADHATVLSLGTVAIGDGSGTGGGHIGSSGLLSAINLTLGDNASGTLVIEGGGLVGGSNNLVSSGTVTVGTQGGTGVLRAFDAARVSVNNVNVATDQGSTGSVSIESDTSFQAGGNLVIGSDVAGGGTATVVVDHASLGVGGSLTIGRGGDLGLLQIKDGASFSVSGNATVGSNGLMLVTDPSSLAFVAGSLTVSGPVAAVPVPNTNLVAVQNGAELDATGITVGNGGTGTLVADGSATLVDNFAATTIGGAGGTGTVVLKNGATFKSTGTVTVDPGGTLIGSGRVVGTVVNAGGTVVPGGSPGVLEVTGDFTQTSGLLSFELFGATPDLYDRMVVGGNLDLTGTMRLIFDFQPDYGTVFDLITVGGTANFAGLNIDVVGLYAPVVTGFSNGQFTVEVVPEPVSFTLVLAGVVALLPLSRRFRLGGR